MKKRFQLLIAIIGCFNLIVPSFAQTTAENARIRIADDIEVIRLSERILIHVSMHDIPPFGNVASNGVILVDRGKAFLFDTPVTVEQTRTLADWIAHSLQAEIVGFIPNHWHGDAMGGLSYLQQLGIDAYAYSKTIDIARSRGLPQPNHGFEESLTLKLNDIDIHAYFMGGGHSTDNIVVWIPSEGLLFPGCMVKDLDTTSLGNLSDADIEAWPGTIEKVLNAFPEAQWIVPGHGDVGDRSLLIHTRNLLLE